MREAEDRKTGRPEDRKKFSRKGAKPQRKRDAAEVNEDVRSLGTEIGMADMPGTVILFEWSPEEDCEEVKK